MLALYRCGRQAEALDAYRQARATLVEQIGVEPGGELRRLQQAILDQDPALDLPSAPVARAARPQRPPPRRAPVLRSPRCSCSRGVVAFGISRVMQPDSLARIDENSVGRIEADSGRITAQYRVGHGPEAVVAGAGSVWVANRLDGTVSRIDRDARRGRDDRHRGRAEPGSRSAPDRSGSTNGQGRTVAQVDPAIEQGRKETFDVGNEAHAVAVGDGAVWVASAVDATVVADRPDRRRHDERVPVDARPSALAAGAGAIWVASDAKGARDPARRALAARRSPRSAVGNGPSGIAVGAGAVWVANRRDGTVSRIDPATEVTETLPVGREPSDDRGRRGCRLGRERRRWHADADRPPEPQGDRDDPDREQPAALAVVDGNVWTAALAATATHRGGTLHVSISGDPDYPFAFDIGYDRRVALLSGLVYDGLLGYRRAGGSAGGTLVPNLARDVPEPSADGRTYLFRLRPDVRFSNGELVTPEDVHASFENAVAGDRRSRRLLPRSRAGLDAASNAAISRKGSRPTRRRGP